MSFDVIAPGLSDQGMETVTAATAMKECGFESKLLNLGKRRYSGFYMSVDDDEVRIVND